MFQIPPLRKLRSQLVLTFLAGFLGIVTAIGIPVMLIVNRQAASQAQLLLGQAVLTTQAALLGEQYDLQNLALLISQRPTLARLLDDQDLASLDGYLNTIRQSAGLDLLIVCRGGEGLFGAVDGAAQLALCVEEADSGFAYASPNQGSLLYAAASLETSGASPYRIVAGKNMASLLTQLQTETGLGYVLIKGNRAIAASEPFRDLGQADVAGLVERAGQSGALLLGARALDLHGHQYIFALQGLDPAAEFELISALNVDEQVALQRSLSRTIISGLLLIILIASGLGLWASQRISQPIVRLAQAASRFRQRDLTSAVSIQSTVWEIGLLANTLEDARIALQHSLEQLEAEKAWIEQLLNSIVEGMLTLDHQNRITFASAGVGKILECEAGQVTGRKADAVFATPEGEAAFTSQLPGTGQQRRVSVRLKSGQERLLSISKADFIPPEAGSTHRALVLRDVTNEEYIHRLLGDFLANVTHEFRTPLAALEASSELLLDNLKSLSQAEIEELLVSLHLGITNLQALIDNLIEAASIEAGRFKVSVQPVTFERILQEAQEVIQPLARKYGLRLACKPVTEPVLVLADQRRTVQVLVNLLSNAIKHSPENSTIRVEHSIEAGTLRVEVIDEGSGIPVEQRDILFRRFAHLDVPNERARQGAGLGLSVVKAIVEAHSGQVGVTGRPEGGTAFWFTLPLAGEGRA